MNKCNYCNEEHKNNNVGCGNSGDFNSGNRNSGYRNSGDYNSGDRNSGDRNSGDYNSGDYNSGDRNSGWFNTDEPKMRMFNRETDITYSEFMNGKIVYPNLKICAWVNNEDLPEDEQTTDTKNMDGKLKTLTYKEAWKEYWSRASEEDKEWFKNLPNFDAEIFEEITGINVEQDLDLKGQEVEVKIGGKTYKAVIK